MGVEMFKRWLAEMPTTELIEFLNKLSIAIVECRSKAFCTLEQKETLERDLIINQILLQVAFEELTYSRELTEDEEEKLRELMNQRVA